MKRIVLSAAALVLLTTACNRSNVAMEQRLSDLEKKVAQLEKRPAMPSRPMPAPQDKAYNIPVGDSPVLGNKDAKVSVVIFSDFQCPFCSRTDPFLQEIVKDPELKDKVNVVFKQFPLSFHPNAKPAAKAALAAKEQGKFWEMSTKLYSNQQELTEANFLKWAKDIGLNVAKFQADLKNNDAKYEDVIKKDMDMGTTEAKVRGTPSIYVGGWELNGERSIDGIKAVLKEKNLG